ncbi:MFS transporter [Streptomyces sp. YC504]|uniref:MFS transporter n=1 Tax=Streptomyces mesophilus TaxID=1775132 RepID=A0A6G4XT10_9ACTN|nr:MFS transporter [Streptomyces mesophilus]NGO80705.1 MFS transporter [Streptomyces mesophilus]
MSNVQVNIQVGEKAAGVRGWLAVAAVALGIFTVITAELLPVGLLTPMGSALEVSDGTTGLLVTVPGLVAAVCAPLLTVVSGRLDRRLVLAALMALVAVAHVVSALAGHFAYVLGARVLLGVGIGGFWAFAGGLAPRLVPAHQVGRATAVIFGGVAAASVLGVPAGTLAGELGGWRLPFAVLAGLSLLVLAALLLLLPPLPPQRGLTTGDLTALLRRNPRVRTGLTLTALLVTGHFLAYTFVRPVLAERYGISGAAVGWLLLGYGVLGLAGNFFAGALGPRRILLISSALTAALTALALLPGGSVTGALLLLAWGLAYGGVSVALQTWFLTAAPDDIEGATSLNVAVFCLSIALGALLGGRLVDSLPMAAVPAAAAALVLAAALVAHRKETRP